MKNITLRIIMFLVIICESAIASDFSDLYDRVSESVVTVVTNQTNKSLSGQNIVSTQQVISGSGVISDANGLVITASHVINLADQVEVYLKNGNIYAAEIIASFPFADIALLRINDPPQDLSVARMGDSDALRIGEEVVIIGAPHGFSQTLTVGHFSGRPENTGSFNVADTEFLQTDAAINPGNSGGPMFNSRGEVVGIVSHIRTGSNGMGFAASSNMVRDLFVKFGAVWGGLEILPMDDVLARAINFPFTGGVLVQEVADGSLASKLGVRAGVIPSVIEDRHVRLGGDVILSIGGHKVNFEREAIERAYQYMAERKKGEKIVMTVYRNGEQVELSVSKP